MFYLLISIRTRLKGVAFSINFYEEFAQSGVNNSIDSGDQICSALLFWLCDYRQIYLVFLYHFPHLKMRMIVGSS